MEAILEKFHYYIDTLVSTRNQYKQKGEVVTLTSVHPNKRVEPREVVTLTSVHPRIFIREILVIKGMKTNSKENIGMKGMKTILKKILGKRILLL
jgi:hypothetical protein